MARKPKQNHPLRELRAKLGKSQKDFARSLGISPSFLKLVENGKRPITQELTGRIMMETGVMLLETKEEPLEIPMLDGLSETQWKQLQTSSIFADMVFPTLAKRLQIMLAASARPASGKALQVFLALLQAFKNIEDQFQLQKHIDAELRDRHMVETKKYRVGDLRENSLLAGMVQFKDNPKLKDDDELVLSKPVSALDPRDLFNLYWSNRDLFAQLMSLPEGTKPEDIPLELKQRLETIEKREESLFAQVVK